MTGLCVIGGFWPLEGGLWPVGGLWEVGVRWKLDLGVIGYRGCFCGGRGGSLTGSTLFGIWMPVGL